MSAPRIGQSLAKPANQFSSRCWRSSRSTEIPKQLGLFSNRRCNSSWSSPSSFVSKQHRNRRTLDKSFSRVNVPSVKSRHQSTYQSAKALFKRYPFSMTSALAAIVFGAGAIVYANVLYKTYIIGAFSTFPEAVAKPLRKALYYSNVDSSPREAIRYYQKALEVADELRMDPFSDEVLGIKIQLAQYMERINRFQSSIHILEILKGDCQRWMELLGSKEGNEGARTRILGKSVGISVKLGELYANEYVREENKAEECLIWAVETVLKEQKRREDEGTKPGEGEWLSPEEIGGSLEALGHLYEGKNQHYLAAPLFLQAIALSPPKSCHMAVLMNNLSICLAQQVPPTYSSSSTTPSLPPATSRPALVANAREWARKAIDVASRVQPPERDPECDLGCAIATHNLAEFAEMDGDVAEARRRYEEAKSLAKALGFAEGVENADEGLARIAAAEH